MKDDEFTALCEAHSFGAVARKEFAMIPRAMLKALVDAGVAAERERCAAFVDHILREGGGTWGDWLRASGKPPCCAGGPQWGHAWDCKKCPD